MIAEQNTIDNQGFNLELASGANKGATVFGVDEVGRGALAGPIIAGASWINLDLIPEAISYMIVDSKALTQKSRAKVIISTKPYAVIELGIAEVAEINATNILVATLKAMERAINALVNTINREPTNVLVDGNKLPTCHWPTQAVVKGDKISKSIALASIMAKQTRDSTMSILAKSYQGYGWERNAGYGTVEHKKALAKLGVTQHHRQNFAPIRALLQQPEVPSITTCSL
ncbi:ribonuclease HII [Candidatus Endolissoclinum faulkneri L5]|uniref:Ribonuclease n=1 Tax=Candidatus Endolissoclinum faulkneri L5 TaxID=1401328 RepID=V9TUR7_9PROT|nr:ribonuclease HII [Candidatus Endolissoclinum faulkneri]AHC73433.1 ribonuclease HII [Candidatus Endolissoclinum faulkneri L5]